jgi:hypothetical protein
MAEGGAVEDLHRRLIDGWNAAAAAYGQRW